MQTKCKWIIVVIWVVVDSDNDDLDGQTGSLQAYCFANLKP